MGEPDRALPTEEGDERPPVLTRPTVRRALKWSWIVVVVAVTGALLASEWSSVSGQLRTMSPTLVVLGVVLTVAAKLALGENARLAAVAHDIDIDRPTAIRLYNLSQLGKYLPGSVWQFVGRAAAYRSLGADAGAIRDALLTESLWVVAGALTIGIVVSGPTVLPVALDSLPDRALVWLGVGVGVAIVLVGLLAALRREWFVRYLRAARPTAATVTVQVVVWLLLGVSFAAIARAADVPVPVPYAVGLFATAYAIGFLVLFVPAGLGVRDGLLTIGLLPYAATRQVLVVVIVARLVYVAVELLLVLVAELRALAAGRG